MDSSIKYIGQEVTVTMDRPLGSKHPKHGFEYPVNYGFIANTVSGDGEELDAYVLGIHEAVDVFKGRCIGVIHRTNDNDDKLVVVPDSVTLSAQEIEEMTAFQEKWFEHVIILKQPEVHLIFGFMGFGKTTLAKKLEQDLQAVRYTPDDLMLEKFGRTPDNFQARYVEVDRFILSAAANDIANGRNVILDYGFWSKAGRRQYYEWATALTDNVYFDVLNCDIETAKKRVLRRTFEDEHSLFIDEGCFDDRFKSYEPITQEEGYPIILHEQ